MWSWFKQSNKSADQIYAEGIAKKMTKPKSDNETIANYENQTQQIKDMKWVLICAITAGTSLMVISVLAPFITVNWIHVPLSPDTIDKLVSTPGAVLPLATGLVGFAGGVVTAMFRTSTITPEKIRPSQALPSQALPSQDACHQLPAV